MIILKWLALFLTFILIGCVDFFDSTLNRRMSPARSSSTFDNPMFASYETYQTHLERLDNVDFMSDDEIEDLLFSDDYRIYPEFLSYIDHYKELKGHFTGNPLIKDNIKFIMTDLGNIATETDFMKFKEKRELKGIAGECLKSILDNGRPLRLVMIDYTFWNLYSSSLEKARTMFHELGHCDLDRKDELNYTSSLMAYKSVTLDRFKSRSLSTVGTYELYQELFDPEKINNRYDQGESSFKLCEDIYYLNQYRTELQQIFPELQTEDEFRNPCASVDVEITP